MVLNLQAFKGSTYWSWWLSSDFDPGDSPKFDQLPVLHLVFRGFDSFISEFKGFPITSSKEDAQKLVSIANNINESWGDVKLEDINPKLLQHFAFGAKALLNPMAVG